MSEESYRQRTYARLLSGPVAIPDEAYAAAAAALVDGGSAEDVVVAAAPHVVREARIDTLKAVLVRAQNGATGRALLLWVSEQLQELEAEDV